MQQVGKLNRQLEARDRSIKTLKDQGKVDRKKILNQQKTLAGQNNAISRLQQELQVAQARSTAVPRTLLHPPQRLQPALKNEPQSPSLIIPCKWEANVAEAKM